MIRIREIRPLFFGDDVNHEFASAAELRDHLDELGYPPDAKWSVTVGSPRYIVCIHKGGKGDYAEVLEGAGNIGLPVFREDPPG